MPARFYLIFFATLHAHCLWIPYGREVSLEQTLPIEVNGPFILARASMLGDESVTFAEFSPFVRTVIREISPAFRLFDRLCPELLGRSVRIDQIAGRCPQLAGTRYIVFVPDIGDRCPQPNCTMSNYVSNVPHGRHWWVGTRAQNFEQLWVKHRGVDSGGIERLCLSMGTLGFAPDFAPMTKTEDFAVIAMQLDIKPPNAYPRFREFYARRERLKSYLTASWTWLLWPFFIVTRPFSDWPLIVGRHYEAHRSIDGVRYEQLLREVLQPLVAGSR